VVGCRSVKDKRRTHARLGDKEVPKHRISLQAKDEAPRRSLEEGITQDGMVDMQVAAGVREMVVRIGKLVSREQTSALD